MPAVNCEICKVYIGYGVSTKRCIRHKDTVVPESTPALVAVAEPIHITVPSAEEPKSVHTIKSAQRIKAGLTEEQKERRRRNLADARAKKPSMAPIKESPPITGREQVRKLLAALAKEELVKLKDAFIASNDHFIDLYIPLKQDGLAHVFWEWATQLLLTADAGSKDFTLGPDWDYRNGAIDALLFCCQFLRSLDKLDALSSAIEEEFEQRAQTLHVTPVTFGELVHN